jgi:hypothetical protein
MNSFKALWAVAEGSRRISMVWFRQTHSSIASETNCCLVMPRKSHCLVSHSNCFELTSIRSAPSDRSGSSGDDPDSLFRTHQIAGRTWIGFKGICAIIRLRNVHCSPQRQAWQVRDRFFIVKFARFFHRFKTPHTSQARIPARCKVGGCSPISTLLSGASSDVSRQSCRKPRLPESTLMGSNLGTGTA